MTDDDLPAGTTVWVFGDQLNRRIGALGMAPAAPGRVTPSRRRTAAAPCRSLRRRVSSVR